ncbi:DUF4126 family protein [Hymenobacter sp. PAMC 26628]|uniref:DUF4126 family protein n=1 Tax=Hymenobacter sp. PAMC 26628 TaxID=1484118 RepID=UPI0007701082|nr:DUF4126 family protein [Hymenobacter sp. PAMC 26628]AMJ64271.1 hypothetical protein AXW84_01590 [Hymenobacter sp. PAMC 26628]
MKAKKPKAAKFNKDANWPKPAPTARFWPVLGLAALSGMRTTSGPTFLSHYLSRQARPKGLAKSPLRFLQNATVASTLKGLLGLEFVGDKSPKTGNRTEPQQLGARAASGALVGATLYKARGGNALSGALVGSLGAVASTFLTFWLRKTISERTHTHTSLVGLGEDALVVAGGSAWVAAQAKK